MTPPPNLPDYPVKLVLIKLLNNDMRNWFKTFGVAYHTREIHIAFLDPLLGSTPRMNAVFSPARTCCSKVEKGLWNAEAMMILLRTPWRI